MSVCPLCENKIKKPRVVYGHTICKKCWAGYINRRQIAYVIDSFILLVAAFSAGLALGLMYGPDIAWGAFFVTLVLDGIWLGRDAINGRSPGKSCMNLETIDNSSGAPIGWKQAFVRNWPLAIGAAGVLVGQLIEIFENADPALRRTNSGIVGGIARFTIVGFVLVLATQMNKGPRLGDAQANTRVIWRRYGDSPVFNPAIDSSVAAAAEFAPAMRDGATESSNDPYRAPRT